MKVHHIGYLVKDIKDAQDEFIKLGYTIAQDIVFDATRKVGICFLAKDGYNFESDLNNLCGSDFLLIDKPLPAPALENKRVAFLMSYSIGMIELLENMPPPQHYLVFNFSTLKKLRLRYELLYFNRPFHW